jgi:predicted transcriptional regulator YdeE/DNA-binding transcriptional MerR regulator
MIRIGEFSKISQVSIKTLRYYDSLGLLKPAHIDRFSGYRYYDLTQLLTLNRILALKDLDFSLEQIKELIKVDLAIDVMEKLLQNKAIELQGRILDERARLLRVERHLAQRHANPNPVVLKSAPKQTLASIRQVLPSSAHLATWRSEQLEMINKTLKEIRLLPTGHGILIYHQDEYREENLDVEVGVFISDTNSTSKPKPISDSLNIYILPAVNHLATAIHMGPLGQISETYIRLAEWTQLNGFRPIGPWREMTYQEEDPTQHGIIEVQRPVMKAIKFFKQLEIKKMEPEIITKPGFTLVGLRYFGKNQHMEITQLWERFNQRVRELGGIENETGDAAIGLCITPEDEPIGGGFEYVAGFPVTKAENVPQDFVVRQVPEFTYAVFGHRGDLPSLGKKYKYIYETWLPQSGYKLAAKLDFEYYDEDFKNFTADSVFYIYVPIEKPDKA